MAPAIHSCQNRTTREHEASFLNRQKIEDDALHLPKEERVQLIRRLVLSLESPSKKQLRGDWLLEARRRAQELDSGSLQVVPSEEVMSKARALLK